MPRIPLSKAVPGQKLARPVTNASGMVMMQPGAELTAAAIERLSNIGIESIVIVDDSPDASRSPEEVHRVFEARFARHEDDPWMMDLKAIVIRQALRGGGDA